LNITIPTDCRLCGWILVIVGKVRTYPTRQSQSPTRRRVPPGRFARRRLARATAALCLLASGGLAAGCASPSHADSGNPGSCATPGISSHEIRLGLLYPDTGTSQSLFAPFRAGVDARLGVANEAGGVHGRTVSYLWADDRSAPEGNLASATTLLGRGAFALLEGTSAASGSAAFLHAQGVPVVGASLEQPWTIYDNMFSYSNLLASSGSVSTYGDFVAAHGGHRAVLVVSEGSATSVNLAAELAESLRSAGIDVVGRVDAATSISYPTLGAEIKNSGADTLVGAVTGTTFGAAALAALGAQAHLRVLLSPAGYDQRTLDLFRSITAVQTITAGAYFVVDFLPFEADRPGHRQFLAAMARYAPEVPQARQQAALSGWISADLMLRGLQEAGDCPTRAGLIETLRSIHDYTADGLLTEPVDFQADFGKLNPCLSFMQVAPDGQRFVPVTPLPTCGKDISG
jgi:ABC-type branched-subunit amino acid transport system substrate-binding protein